MKSISSIVKHMLLVFPIIFLMGCGSLLDEEHTVKVLAKEANESCPMRLDEMTVLTMVTYENHCFTYFYDLDPCEEADIMMEADYEDIKSFLQEELENSLSDSDLKLFLKTLRETKTKLYYQYTVKDGSGRSRRIEVDYAMLLNPFRKKN